MEYEGVEDAIKLYEHQAVPVAGIQTYIPRYETLYK